MPKTASTSSTAKSKGDKKAKTSKAVKRTKTAKTPKTTVSAARKIGIKGLQKAREGARTDKRNRQQALASVLSQSTNAVASTSGLSSSEKLYYKILRCWPMPLTELFEPQYQPRYTDVDISPYDGKWVKKRCDSDDWPEDVLTELLNLTKRSGMGRQAAFKARDLVIGMMGRRRRSRGPKHEVEGMIVEDVREARRLWE